MFSLRGGAEEVGKVEKGWRPNSTHFSKFRVVSILPSSLLARCSTGCLLLGRALPGGGALQRTDQQSALSSYQQSCPARLSRPRAPHAARGTLKASLSEESEARTAVAIPEEPRDLFPRAAVAHLQFPTHSYSIPVKSSGHPRSPSRVASIDSRADAETSTPPQVSTI